MREQTHTPKTHHRPSALLGWSADGLGMKGEGCDEDDELVKIKLQAAAAPISCNLARLFFLA